MALVSNFNNRIIHIKSYSKASWALVHTGIAGEPMRSYLIPECSCEVCFDRPFIWMGWKTYQTAQKVVFALLLKAHCTKFHGNAVPCNLVPIYALPLQCCLQYTGTCMQITRAVQFNAVREMRTECTFPRTAFWCEPAPRKKICQPKNNWETQNFTFLYVDSYLPTIYKHYWLILKIKKHMFVEWIQISLKSQSISCIYA